MTRLPAIGITCYPSQGGSGIVASELGLLLARSGYEVHFISSRIKSLIRPASMAAIWRLLISNSSRSVDQRRSIKSASCVPSMVIPQAPLFSIR